MFVEYSRKVLTVMIYLDCIMMSLIVCSKVMKGHLQPFGFHRKSEGDIDNVSGFLDAFEFYQSYVYPQKPVIFRGAAKELSIYALWTDQYLRHGYIFVSNYLLKNNKFEYIAQVSCVASIICGNLLKLNKLNFLI